MVFARSMRGSLREIADHPLVMGIQNAGIGRSSFGSGGTIEGTFVPTLSMYMERWWCQRLRRIILFPIGEIQSCFGILKTTFSVYVLPVMQKRPSWGNEGCLSSDLEPAPHVKWVFNIKFQEGQIVDTALMLNVVNEGRLSSLRDGLGWLNHASL